MTATIIDGKAIAARMREETRAEAQALIAAGARCATHLFNAMSQLQGREPGLVGAVLSSDIAAGLIADGQHVAFGPGNRHDHARHRRADHGIAEVGAVLLHLRTRLRDARLGVDADDEVGTAGGQRIPGAAQHFVADTDLGAAADGVEAFEQRVEALDRDDGVDGDPQFCFPALGDALHGRRAGGCAVDPYRQPLWRSIR